VPAFLFLFFFFFFFLHPPFGFWHFFAPDLVCGAPAPAGAAGLIGNGVDCAAAISVMKQIAAVNAKSVRKILATEVKNPGRLEVLAVGPSKPRYLPASSPENRVRNRRVEIIHVRD